ncbi:MAG: YggU family protein [Magnetococcales bacterium]|nr:YggU family protein [Magnetococcales bacterium]
MSVTRWEGDDLILAVRVQPRASREKLGGVREGHLSAALTAPPVDGAANEALQKLLARSLEVAPGRVRIVQGEHSRNKTVRIIGPDRETVALFSRRMGLASS